MAQKQLCNYLAIDYGQKTVGLALKLAATSFVMPFEQLPNQPNLLPTLVDIITSYKINVVVLGYPYLAVGYQTASQQLVLAFHKQLQTAVAHLGVQIVWQDEAYSTNQAMALFAEQKALIAAKHQRKHKDSLAAVIILESYLAKQCVPKPPT